MEIRKIVTRSLLHALGAGIYIMLVALFMSNVEHIFGKGNQILSMMAFLLLFVISASVMGLLIFGKPVMLFIEGQKKPAISLALYTIGFAILILALVLAIILLV